MKTWMSCVVMSLMMVIMSGCIDGDTQLADLSADERERVCKRSAHSALTCDDGRDIGSFTEEECIDMLEAFAGDDNCLATVEDLDDMTSDPCSDEAERARRQIFSLSCYTDIF